MNFIARFLRASGRILLAAATILAIGFTVLLLPFSQNQATDSPTHTSETPVVSTPSVQPAPSISGKLLLGFLGFVISCFIILGVYKSLRQYNNALRKAIRNFANLIRCSIYTTEMILTTVLWGIAVTLALIISPYIAIALIFTMILNILCFTFAWLFYGQPSYVA